MLLQFTANRPQVANLVRSAAVGRARWFSSIRPPSIPLKALGAGTVAGGAGSLVGMGGGFVAIPAMTSRWMGLTQHEAHATSLVSVLFTVPVHPSTRPLTMKLADHPVHRGQQGELRLHWPVQWIGELQLQWPGVGSSPLV